MTTWTEARAAGRLPTVESLTPAEQLTRVRDLCATWDEHWYVSPYLAALAQALGVAPHVVRAAPMPGEDALPEPAEVPCRHHRPDGVCTICGDAPLFTDLPVREKERR